MPAPARGVCRPAELRRSPLPAHLPEMVVVVAGNEDGLVAHYRLAGGQRRRELGHDRQAQGGRGQGQFDQVAGGDHARQLAALVGRDDVAQAFDQRDKDRARVL